MGNTDPEETRCAHASTDPIDPIDHSLSEGHVTFRNATFALLNSASNGGAVYASAGITVEDSTVSDNTSISNGGALFSGGPIVITGSQVNGNVLGSHGGVATAGSITATDSFFGGNHAKSAGVFQTVNLAITGSDFLQNRALTGSGGVRRRWRRPARQLRSRRSSSR